MATIRGTYYYKLKRAYKYEVNVTDTEDFNPLGFYIHITNPEGKTAIADWNFRNRGIEQSIKDFIEEKIKNKAK
jgi:hypothetical protein